MFMGGRSCTNSAICYDGEVATKPAQKAELLNKYFCSVFLSATPDVKIDHLEQKWKYLKYRCQLMM